MRRHGFPSHGPASHGPASLCGLACLWAVTVGGLSAARAQNEPHLGYIYPAGGQVGTELRVSVGGQYLDDTSAILFTGQGIEATVVKHHKPLNEGEVNRLREKIDLVRERLEAEGKNFNLRNRRGAYAEFLELIKEMGVTEEDLERLEEFVQRRNDEKRQLNPAIEESVVLQLKVDASATPGRREIRLKTPVGISNPISFHVSIYPEKSEQEPNDVKAGEAMTETFPVVLNGQIMPGDVDRFRFQAVKGDKLVMAVVARELVPYLADAVPGWFQATLALYNAEGREVAYADDFQFHPDPVLYYRIPEDGSYELEIRDSIYRGREDFVYRITVGEIPFLTSVYPLGVQAGQTAVVELRGWNLPVETLTFDATEKEPGSYPIFVAGRKDTSNEMPFVVDSLPELMEQESNNDRATAQPIEPPAIVNGRIDQAGDWDVYRFEGRAGGQVMVQVLARHLGSPLDSLLKLTDADGKQLMINDDFEDLGAGLITHHADSQLHVTLPADGSYFIHLGDTQKKGGLQYAYRLRVSARRPDFELRVVPSTLSVRPGSTIAVTVHALRRDGFDQDIKLSLKEPANGFSISGGWVPADQNKVQITLTVPVEAREEPYIVQLEGRADMRGRELVRPAIPAENMMQAFIYFHLVPAEDLVVYVTGKAPPRAMVVAGQTQKSPDNLLQIPAGSMVRYALSIPNRRNLSDVGVELSEPPAGITLVRVIRESTQLVMLLAADAEMAQPGLQGNLILNVFAERTVPGRNGRPATTRRVPVGTFPAVPFEVVERSP
ncbi:MAG: peptidase [Pirellulaceae bacterium]